MNIKWRYGLAFPLTLSLVLGGLTAWLGSISQVQTEEVRLDPDKPQYTMNGIAGKRFDETGRLKEHLTAEQAWQFPDDKNVHLGRPNLDMYQEGKLLYQIGSEEAVYHTESKQIAFEQQVVLTKPADHRPAGIVRTDHLYVDTQNQTARTEAQVAFEYGDSHGTANGMTYDHRQGLLNFPSKVKAIIYDAKTL
ncbi:LPS export ABC transporter periplasmic protein LptC [Neisseria sp. ZJ106]|uniref:LPS export ABC transporter periplasmic protein LptC n=1 Tax=Neisseria lisongii TaxID=2912188 RepID=A0ABY7RHD5_9NEIS|nr:LPS export ABC transporter periplasmic protein LptC [Neisseria lisongii]MCF7522167.1 LPS export ABC transporter periplasmic protein LptC [Neisseria lisongii]WCL71012.1 LPS export ABC transporter periplasmic protein LptC [Neisseria lisongii]